MYRRQLRWGRNSTLRTWKQKAYLKVNAELIFHHLGWFHRSSLNSPFTWRKHWTCMCRLYFVESELNFIFWYNHLERFFLWNVFGSATFWEISIYLLKICHYFYLFECSAIPSIICLNHVRQDGKVVQKQPEKFEYKTIKNTIILNSKLIHIGFLYFSMLLRMI